MPGDRCRFVTYIAAPAERVWKAILDGQMARGSDAPAEDLAGSPGWAGGLVPVPVPGLVGEVVEADQPRRLVLQWGSPGDAARIRVSFELEPVGAMVRLTVTHDGVRGPHPDRPGDGTGSWPGVLSDLKTNLEGGRILYTWDRPRNA